MRANHVEVFYNGVSKCTEPRADRATFQGVRVFSGDHFYAAASATIDDFYIYRMPSDDSTIIAGANYFVTGSLPIAQRTLLSTVDLPIEYEIGFDITPG
eukprot:SAG11_NODE_6419_length_1318_cov_0.972929_1_plen_98_part_01